MVLAVIGLGSVGYFYSEGLIANGAQVKGYDVMVGRPEFAQRVEQCKAFRWFPAWRSLSGTPTW